MAPRWSEMTDYLTSKGIKVGTATTGQTTGGTHTQGSYHYQGVARDFGVYNCDCPAIAAALKPLATGTNHVIVELIWTPSPLSRSSGPGTYFKKGNAYVPATKLANGHKDHVHAAIRPGAPHWTQWSGAQTQQPQPSQPAPVTPPEEDEDMYEGVFITAPNQGNTWHVYNIYNRRPVGPGENQELVDLGLVKPGKDGKPFVKMIDQARFDAIKVHPDYR